MWFNIFSTKKHKLDFGLGVGGKHSKMKENNKLIIAFKLLWALRNILDNS